MNEADKIIIGLRDVLRARAFYNPELRIVSIGKDSCKRVFEYCCNEAGWDNDRLRELNARTKPIIRMFTFQTLFLKYVRGYKEK